MDDATTVAPGVEKLDAAVTAQKRLERARAALSAAQQERVEAFRAANEASTQREIAAATGLSQPRVGQIISGVAR